MYVWHTLIQLYKPGAPELRLFETDESDVALKHGFLFAMPRLDSKGVRVLVKSSSS